MFNLNDLVWKVNRPASWVFGLHIWKRLHFVDPNSSSKFFLFFWWWNSKQFSFWNGQLGDILPSRELTYPIPKVLLSRWFSFSQRWDVLGPRGIFRIQGVNLVRLRELWQELWDRGFEVVGVTVRVRVGVGIVITGWPWLPWLPSWWGTIRCFDLDWSRRSMTDPHGDLTIKRVLGCDRIPNLSWRAGILVRTLWRRLLMPIQTAYCLGTRDIAVGRYVWTTIHGKSKEQLKLMTSRPESAKPPAHIL